MEAKHAHVIYCLSYLGHWDFTLAVLTCLLMCKLTFVNAEDNMHLLECSAVHVFYPAVLSSNHIRRSELSVAVAGRYLFGDMLPLAFVHDYALVCNGLRGTFRCALLDMGCNCECPPIVRQFAHKLHVPGQCENS